MVKAGLIGVAVYLAVSNNEHTGNVLRCISATGEIKFTNKSCPQGWASKVVSHYVVPHYTAKLAGGHEPPTDAEQERIHALVETPLGENLPAQHSGISRSAFDSAIATSVSPPRNPPMDFQVPDVGLYVTFPGDWTRVPQATLDQVLAELHRRAPEMILPRWIAAYQLLKNPSDHLTFPYVIVQEQRSRPPTPTEMRAAATTLNAKVTADEISRKAAGIFTDYGSQMTYDEASNTVSGTMIVEIDGNVAVVYSRMIATDRGVVSLNGYFEKTDRAAATAFFHPMFSSARLPTSPPKVQGNGTTYNPLEFDWIRRLKIDWTKIGAGLGVVLVGLLFGSRKK